MTGPSLEAIRRFKSQQEKKKLEEEEKKTSQKLATLEHRAAHGDRKAKSFLTKIEKIKELKERSTDVKQHAHVRQQQHQHQQATNKPQTSKPKPATELSFEELMRLAKQNKNELRKPDDNYHQKKEEKIERKINNVERRIEKNPERIIGNSMDKRRDIKIERSIPDRRLEHRRDMRLPNNNRGPAPKHIAIRNQNYHPIHHRASHPRHYDDEEEDDDDLDDFVVDEEDDDVADEVSRTIQSVFRYNKRRCDLRESEIDRQYRAIGRVNTFEDLEREERRASKLAAAEDAKAEREEEERKRLKALRLKKYRDN